MGEAARSAPLTEAAPAAPLHSGWLHKRGHLNPKYKKRWFVLTDSLKLSYYEAPGDPGRNKPKGEVHVAAVGHCDTRHHPGLDRPGDLARAFRFDTTERKPFVVFAETVHAKLEWLQTLLSQLGSLPLNVPCEDLVRRNAPPLLARPPSPSRADTGGGPQPRPVRGGVGAAAGGAAGGGAGAWSLVAAGAVERRAGNLPASRRALETALEACGYVGGAAGQAKSGAQGAKPGGAITDGAACLCALYELGLSYVQESRYTQALLRFDEALFLANTGRGAETGRGGDTGGGAQRQQLLLQAAWCTWHSDRPAEAAAIYSAVLDLDPLCWAALLDRSKMEIARGAWAAALSDLDLVLALRPPPKPPAYCIQGADAIRANEAHGRAPPPAVSSAAATSPAVSPGPGRASPPAVSAAATPPAVSPGPGRASPPAVSAAATPPAVSPGPGRAPPPAVSAAAATPPAVSPGPGRAPPPTVSPEAGRASPPPVSSCSAEPAAADTGRGRGSDGSDTAGGGASDTERGAVSDTAGGGAPASPPPAAAVTATPRHSFSHSLAPGTGRKNSAPPLPSPAAALPAAWPELGGAAPPEMARPPGIECERGGGCSPAAGACTAPTPPRAPAPPSPVLCPVPAELESRRPPAISTPGSEDTGGEGQAYRELCGWAARVLSDRAALWLQIEPGPCAQAAADAELAISLQPDYAQAFVNRGTCHCRMGLTVAARADFSRAIEMDGSSARAYNNRGALFLTEARHAEALADFEQAIRLDPHCEVALRNHALTARHVGGQRKHAQADRAPRT